MSRPARWPHEQHRAALAEIAAAEDALQGRAFAGDQAAINAMLQLGNRRMQILGLDPEEQR